MNNIYLSRFLDRWTEDTRFNRDGIHTRDISPGKEIADIPKIFEIRPYIRNRELYSYPESFPLYLKIDVSHFKGFLFRGITGPGLKRGYASHLNEFKAPPITDIIKRYKELGYMTCGMLEHSYSAEPARGIPAHKNAIYTTKNPLVAFSSDESGPFATPDGAVFVIEDTGTLKATETHRDYIDEVIIEEKVSLDNIKSIYVSEKHKREISDMLKGTGINIKSHNFGTEQIDMFRKDGLLGIIKETTDMDALLAEKYPSREAKKLLIEGLELYKYFIGSYKPLSFGFGSKKDTYSLDIGANPSSFKDKITSPLYKLKHKISESSFANIQEETFISPMLDEIENSFMQNMHVSNGELIKDVSLDEAHLYSMGKADELLFRWIFDCVDKIRMK